MLFDMLYIVSALIAIVTFVGTAIFSVLVFSVWPDIQMTGIDEMLWLKIIAAIFVLSTMAHLVIRWSED